MPSINSAAPDFTVSDQDGNDFSLSNQRGKKIVLYFYPKDDTPGCTLEALQFTALADKFKEVNTIVAGISKDDSKCHTKFIAKHSLNIILLADVDTSVCQLYGVWKEKYMYGKKYMGIDRTTFIIDAQGVIRHIFEKVKPEGHAEEVLRVIEGIN